MKNLSHLPRFRTAIALLWGISLVSLLPLAPNLHAATQGARGTVKAAPSDDIHAPARGAEKPPASTPGTLQDKLLWDSWYTVTVNKTIHYEYYNDRAEVKQGRVVLRNKAWKLEEKYINEEQIGAFAQADADLTPLFFNFHSSFRSTETSIDGTVKDAARPGGNKELVVRVKKGGIELPSIKKPLPSKTILSEHFPVWLAMRLPGFKPGQVYSFQTVMEDSLEAGFAVINGQVRVEAQDETARRLQATKVLVNYQGMKSYWWLDSSGAPVRIEMPTQKAVVERVSQDEAKAFLKTP